MNFHGDRSKLNIFPIPESYFSRIEYALGIKLNSYQIEKFKYPERYIVSGRCTGRTTAHLVLVALSIGSPIRLELVSDREELHYTYGFFANEYNNLVRKLESVGFTCREVYFYKGGLKITIGGCEI